MGIAAHLVGKLSLRATKIVIVSLKVRLWLNQSVISTSLNDRPCFITRKYHQSVPSILGCTFIGDWAKPKSRFKGEVQIWWNSKRADKHKWIHYRRVDTQVHPYDIVLHFKIQHWQVGKPTLSGFGFLQNLNMLSLGKFWKWEKR